MLNLCFLYNWTASDARRPLVIPGATKFQLWLDPSPRHLGHRRDAAEKPPQSAFPDASNCLKKHNERVTNACRGEATTRGAASKDGRPRSPRDQCEGVLMINSSLRK